MANPVAASPVAASPVAANPVAASKSEGILQTCKSCAHEFRAPQKLVGKDMPCPYCRRMMLISEVKVVNDFITHDPDGRYDLRGQGGGPYSIVAAR